MATASTTVEVGDLATLLPDWLRSLRAENKAANTLTGYEQSGVQLLAFLRQSGMPTNVAHITREHVETFVERLLATRKPATAANRYRALQRLFAYLVEEGEITESPMARMHPPKVPVPETPVLSDDELRALFGACEGARFEDRRDMAMFRLLADTGCRSNELTSLKIEDLDRDAQVIYVMGKGSKPRACPYGAKTAQAIDRYMRMRGRHRLAASPFVWIGLRGKVTNEGLRLMLANRSKKAAIGRVHPHMLRHCFAHRWLSRGGNEGDLMRLAGWKSREMLSRYGASAADERARDAYRRMGLGDEL